jgi:hypothetical protein
MDISVGARRPVLALKATHFPTTQEETYCVDCRGLLLNDAFWVLGPKGWRHKDKQACERIKDTRGRARTANAS